MQEFATSELRISHKGHSYHLEVSQLAIKVSRLNKPITFPRYRMGQVYGDIFHNLKQEWNYETIGYVIMLYEKTMLELKDGSP